MLDGQDFYRCLIIVSFQTAYKISSANCVRRCKSLVVAMGMVRQQRPVFKKFCELPKSTPALTYWWHALHTRSSTTRSVRNFSNGAQLLGLYPSHSLRMLTIPAR